MPNLHRPAFLPLLAAGFSLAIFLPTAATATGGTHPGGACNADGGHAHVSIGDAMWDEDDGTVVFTVTCNPCGKVNANFVWSVTGGSATEGVDYTISGLNMTVGTTSADNQTEEITVQLIDDATFEGNETIIIGGPDSVDNGNPSVLTPCLILDPATPTATGTIVEDDPMNSPPTAEANGPYSVDEGGSVGLSSSGSSDPDGDPLTFDWDLDNNGSFETPGESPSFSAVGRDGPDTQTVVLRVSDGTVSDTDTATVNISNVAPAVGIVSVDPEPSNEGSAVTASATFTDPGTSDTHTCTVNYGDGSGDLAGTLIGNSCDGPSHVYVDDDPTGTPSDAYTVTVTVTDDDGGSDSNTGNHQVDNVAPIVGAVTVSPEPSDEGSSVTASADFTDPGAADTHTCTVDYGDGEGGVAGTIGGSTCTGPSHTYADNGIYTVTVTVTDDDTGVGSETGSHQVDNVDPTITASTNSAEECGDTSEAGLVEISADFEDPGFDSAVAGTLEEFGASEIDWGDGTVEPATVSETPGGVGTLTTGTVSGDHVYATGGIFEIIVTVTDDDGGSDSITLIALVTGIGLNGGELQVVGTPDPDAVRISRKRDKIVVNAELPDPDFEEDSDSGSDSDCDSDSDSDGRRETFPLADVTSIRVLTCPGDDRVCVHRRVPQPAILETDAGSDLARAGGGASALFGGEGDDHLIGGLAGDALDGSSGNDRLRGSRGSDVLLGGPGDDRLFGEHGDDFMDGGAGIDVCKDNRGVNTFVNCEGSGSDDDSDSD